MSKKQFGEKGYIEYAVELRIVFLDTGEFHYIAKTPDYEYVKGIGNTSEEALQSLKEALEMLIEERIVK